MRLLAACALVLGVALGWPSSVVASPGDEVRIDTGRIKGVVSGKVVAFKGIPFAAPPVGDLRWRPPQPAPSWTGVRSAAEYAADCMQLPFPSDAAPLGTKPAEDCLYANVWKPAASASEKLPVLVWIYGGGFVNGGSSPEVYSGAKFAERGVLFVSFNYRVGRFGFFAFPALTNEAADGPVGNYGYMDQIAALQWVQRNAAAFGGDPHNVTLFGESAGGRSVLALMASPMAKGLFQKAVIESGGGRDSVLGERPLKDTVGGGPPSGEAVGVAFAKKMGIAGTDAAALAALRALPAEKIVNGLNMATMFDPTYGGPLLDGKVVAEPTEMAFRRGHQAKIPIMIGANSMDIGFSMATTMDQVLAPFGGAADKARAAYDPQGTNNVRAVGSVVAADGMMVEPARFVVRLLTAAGVPAFEYRFSYVAESMRKQWPGAPHATEIPFVFDTVAAKYGKDLTSPDEATAQAANAYWVEFAKSGDPGSAGGPRWPRYDPAKDELLNFTASGPVAQADAWKTRLDLTESLAAAGKH
jgi:para-nitrobenzyl esterase